MQEELDQKDRTIRELKVQLDESLTLNEKLNSENKTENIQALKNNLRKTKELLQSEKEKTNDAKIMTEECQDKLRQAEQERDYALSHQKKVEIPVENRYSIKSVGIVTRQLISKLRKNMICRWKNWQADIKQKQSCMKHRCFC